MDDLMRIADTALGIADCRTCGVTIVGEANQNQHVTWHNDLAESLAQLRIWILEAKLAVQPINTSGQRGWPTTGVEAILVRAGEEAE